MKTFDEKLKHHVTGAIERGERESIVEIPMRYKKIRFTGKRGNTAGIVIDENMFSLSVSDLSRLFPYSEAMKMERLEVSPVFDSWDDAFAYQF